MQLISVGVKTHRIYVDIVPKKMSLNCSQKGSNMLTTEREHNYDEATCGSSLEKLSVTFLNGIYRQNPDWMRGTTKSKEQSGNA